MDDAREKTEEPCPGPDGHIFKGQFRMTSISAASLRTRRCAPLTNQLDRRGGLFLYSASALF